MSLKSLGIVSLLVAVVSGCAAADETGSETQDVTSEHQLPGFDERLLTGGMDGKLTVVHVGKKLEITNVANSHGASPIAVHGRDGKFEAVFADGMLEVIHPETGAIEHSVKLPAADPGDVEVASAKTAWVTDRTKGKVVEFDRATGKELASVDLSSLAGGGKIEPRNMLRVGENLFVQVARRKDNRAAQGAIAVIAKEKLSKVIELVNDKGEPGLEPDFPMAFDAKRKAVFVSAKGNRPSNTGMLLRIDPDTLTIRDVKDAESGFQGIAVIAPPFDDLFIIYHTSTPTTSSHLFPAAVKADGTLVEANKTLVDAFDGIDALSINGAGTLVAMANTCITGFCIGGAGVSFVDVKTKKVLPKLLKAQLGFEPEFVSFLTAP